ncbi:type VI secretion system domain-containing protein, partial [Pseudomonas syringae pv. tagetis]|uniref:type VI secretion system domain-containing protein n=1 Tax=Pseudomonas syringae group genomosp. 7 TaxID=251699 RepID=UPI00376F70E3
VVHLYFSDATPFAFAESLQWISAQIVPPVPPVQLTFDIDSRQSSPEWDSAYEELLQTLQDNGLKAVVQVLTQRMSD